MSNLAKPRFHDEECFGPAIQNGPESLEAGPGADLGGANNLTCEALMQSARDHFLNENVRAAVDDIIAAYAGLAQDKAKLAALRNLAFKELATSKGWQAAPHPQALRLRRLTPSIPLHSP